MKKKTKKTANKTQLRKKLDVAWSIAVKDRANNKCEVCGKATYLNSHHIVGRRNLALRWEIFNGVCLCSGCHTFKTNSAHQNPLWFDEWLKNNRNDDVVLCKNSMSDIKKWTLEGMRDKLCELKL
jgi:5-methylcytosine-specific restriction endonuclease McrA